MGGRCARTLRARGVEVVGYGEGTYAESAAEVPNVAVLEEYTPRVSGGAARVRFAETIAGDERRTLPLSVTLPGKHMALNGIGAVLGCVLVGGGLGAVLAGIAAFGGVHRRFEVRGIVDDVAVVDDYAHHPTEVRAVLTAARDVVAAAAEAAARDRGPGARPPGRVLAVFQPHLYSRTVDFAHEFAAALDLADEVFVADVYGAREAPQPGVSGATISDLLSVPGRFVADLSALPELVAQRARPGDIVLTIGAGDITMQGPEILAALADRPDGSRTQVGEPAG